ncbi:MAG: ion transporter [Pirellulaceae bacterium]
MTKQSQQTKLEPVKSGWRNKLYEVIFEADTYLGIAFDVLLLIAIVSSVLIVCIETTYPKNHPRIAQLEALEWFFTSLFIVEYVLRIVCVRNPWRYITSFFGIIDLLACLPGILMLFSVDATSMSVVRLFRIIRVFRLFKLGWFVSEADDLGRAVWRARAKIIVFLTIVLITVTIAGSLMYELERHHNPQFESIPQAVYWAVVTMTTVGYGDIVPKSIAGKFLSAVLIVIGYSLIIVPTGFVSAELVDKKTAPLTTRVCESCFREGHDADARFCKWCGSHLS